MKNKRQNLLFLLMLVLSVALVVFTGCSEDDDGDVDDRDPIELTREGWQHFEEWNWEDALTAFEDAIAIGYDQSDAYSGAGWTYYMLGESNEAMSNWNEGLTLVGDHSNIIVGIGLQRLYEENYDAAIDRFESALDNNLSYSFEHMPRLNYNDLRINIAFSFYNLAEFDSSLFWVNELNPNFSVDFSNSEGLAELMTEIERLQAVYR